MRNDLREAGRELAEVKRGLEETTNLLEKTGVKEFRVHLDAIEAELREDMANLKMKSKLKTDMSDTLKLEEMLLNMLNFSYENTFKKFASKAETKKALVFLEKKMNALTQAVHPEEEEKDGLVVTKGIKCISCSKDFGNDYDGNRP